MADSQKRAGWVDSLPADKRARMRAHLKRRRQVRDAVRPHAEHREAERRLREEADATSDPDRRRALLRQADLHAGAAADLVKMIDGVASGGLL